MRYSLVDLALFALAFMAGYYVLAHYTSTGKAY